MEEKRKKVPFYNQIEKYMIVSMFLVMTVIIALNVVTRFVFNFTLSWGEQLARLLLVWTSFAGISWAGMINAHMRVTALSLMFKKNPKIFETIYFLGDIVAVIWCHDVGEKPGSGIIRASAGTEMDHVSCRSAGHGWNEYSYHPETCRRILQYRTGIGG